MVKFNETSHKEYVYKSGASNYDAFRQSSLQRYSHNISVFGKLSRKLCASKLFRLVNDFA